MYYILAGLNRFRAGTLIMRKIPSLFVRDWEGNPSWITTRVDPECQWVADGEGIATQKFDGTSCLIRDGRLLKRFEIKQGKPQPPNFEPCGEADPLTGNQVGWVPIGDGPEDRWHREAMEPEIMLPDGTYELCGPKVQGNPERTDRHVLIRHGSEVEDGCPRDHDGIKAYLDSNEIEGIVWHHPDGRMAKIKARDFGVRWPR